MRKFSFNKKGLSSKIHLLFICVFLILAPLSVYWQVNTYEFVNFDDDDYIFQNYHVKKGLTFEGIKWAFSYTEKSYWHPLAWLSHMLDCQVFGLDSGMHHIMNLMIHIANGLLLFFVLMKMTRAPIKSAFVAALFALHPINVDTVAWVAERKNILSTFFWLLAMLVYFFYTKKPTIHRYSLLFGVITLGLLAKPMLVTLPFVFLLLDYWPLKRINLDSSGVRNIDIDKKQVLQCTPFPHLILEKIPLIILSLVVVYISSRSIQTLGASVGTEIVSMKLRIANAVVSYVMYIWKMLWPNHLTFYYPYPAGIPLWKIAGSLLVIVSITVLAFKSVRRYPYFLVGWLWYLGTLVPVIGIVQGGLWPAIAERWAYVPLIGIFIIIAWGVSDLVMRLPYRRIIIVTAVTSLCMILMSLTWIQASYWQNDYSLCEHALKVDSNNYVAHNNLGMVYRARGETDKAIYHYSQALRISPKNANANSNLANALVDQGKMEEALRYYTQALRIKPDNAETHYNLGSALEKVGKAEEAAYHYTQALKLNPHLSLSNSNLGNVYLAQGMLEEAINQYREALRISPRSAQAHYNLGNALARQDKMDEAIVHYKESLQIDRNYVNAYNNLGNAMATLGKYNEAIEQYLLALKINPDFTEAQKNLKIVRDLKKKADQSEE